MKRNQQKQPTTMLNVFLGQTTYCLCPCECSVNIICIGKNKHTTNMRTLEKSSLYYAFLQGGAYGIKLNKNELCLRRVTQFGDQMQIVVAIAKYISSSNLFTRILHLEGEEMFGSTKRKANLLPRSKVNSHQHDQVNFFHPKVANAIALINQLLVVDVGEANGPHLIITHNGVEVLKCFCGDGNWRIERCPLKLNNCCLAL